jgi:tetratricopeptide (TPR) repeat protein
VGCVEALRIAAATTLENSAQLAQVEKAVALDPGNAILHGRLASLYGDSLEPSSLAAAAREAQRATALDPNNTGSWLTLASTCEAVRDHACADQATERALDLSPMVPQVWWTAANHYLRADQAGLAFSCFHRLLQLSPDYAAPTFALALRAYGDPGMILEKVVGNERNSRLELAFADFMSANEEFDAAHRAWARVADADSVFPFASVQPYLERLLAHGRYHEAQAVWSNLEGRGVIAKPPDGGQDNLMFNGGFEQPPIGAGFDWRSQPSSYVSADFADPAPYEGAHCLRVDFPVGLNDAFEPVFQIVPVSANQAYALTAYVRSSDITSDSGPRLRVTDADCPSCLDTATETTVGTTPWHKLALKFTAGAQTHAVRVSVWRPRSRVFPMEISGTFWLDAVSMRAEPQ